MENVRVITRTVSGYHAVPNAVSHRKNPLFEHKGYYSINDLPSIWQEASVDRMRCGMLDRRTVSVFSLACRGTVYELLNGDQRKDANPHPPPYPRTSLTPAPLPEGEGMRFVGSIHGGARHGVFSRREGEGIRSLSSGAPERKWGMVRKGNLQGVSSCPCVEECLAQSELTGWLAALHEPPIGYRAHAISVHEIGHEPAR